jgi:AraC family transcriptional regulator
MKPRFECISQRLLIGRRLSMSLAKNRTYELWIGFMPRRKEISSTRNSDLISMQVYGESHDHEDIDAVFEKWAAVEVSNFDAIPEEMEKYTIEGGLYAVFDYHGDSRLGAQVFSYIIATWLPSSPYVLDSREHFEILGAKYKTADPDSEEEIWIPVKLKHQ